MFSLRNVHAFATGGIQSLAKTDQVAPLHSIILWIATALGGDNAFTMRLPSAISGILVIPAIYLLAMRLFKVEDVALISAALVAFSPYDIWYSQDARMYSLLLLWSCLYVALAWPVVERPLRILELVLLTIITVLGLYTHHFIALLTATFGLFLFMRGGLAQSRVWAWLATQIAAFAGSAFWLILTADKLNAQAGLTKPLAILWMPYTFFSFAEGLSFGPSIEELRLVGAGTAIANHAFSIGVAACSTGFLIILGLRRAVRAETRVAGIWLVLWLFVPTGLIIIATFVAPNINYNVRYAVISYPSMALLLALAIQEVSLRDFVYVTQPQPMGRSRSRIHTTFLPLMRLVAVATFVVCVAASLFNWYFGTAYAKEDVRPLALLLRNDLPPNAVVILDCDWQLPILVHYGAPLPANLLQISPPRSTLQAALKVADRFSLEGPRDVWLVEYRVWESDPTRRMRSRLDTTATLVDERNWPGVLLRRYRTMGKVQ